MVSAALLLLHVSVSWATDTIDDQTDRPVSIGLGIVDGKVSGSVDDQPVQQVLDVLSAQGGFIYDGPEALLDREVSGTFEGVPLLATLKQLLAPFNYYLIVAEDPTKITRLVITGLRGSPGERPLADESADPEIPPAAVTQGPAGELTEQERAMFEVAHERMGPPPELLEYFEPVQAPGTELTGPPVPADLVVRDLPEFDAIISDTGPVDPNAPAPDVMPADPDAGETGPSLEGPSR